MLMKFPFGLFLRELPQISQWSELTRCDSSCQAKSRTTQATTPSISQTVTVVRTSLTRIRICTLPSALRTSALPKILIGSVRTNRRPMINPWNFGSSITVQSEDRYWRSSAKRESCRLVIQATRPTNFMKLHTLNIITQAGKSSPSTHCTICRPSYS